MSVKLNFILEQGSTFSNTFALVDANNSPLNVQTAVATSQFRKFYTSTNSYTFSTSVDSVNSSVILSMDSNTTANITFGRYVYDVKLAYANNFILRALEGIVTVTPQTTQ